MRSRILFLFTACLFFTTAAYAGGSRLQQFVNYSSVLYDRWSDDDGVTWSSWYQVPTTLASGCSVPSNFWFAFDGIPTAISDQPGRLWLVAKTQQSYLMYNVIDTSGFWSGWCFVPGTSGWGAYFNSQAHNWMSGSSPSLASWGPGRLELK